MAEKDSTENSKRKQIRRLPSVPFLWEEKPGIPKKDWKPGTCSLNPVLPPPVTLVASIPFNWEEMPGKPLPCFSQPSPKLEAPSAKLLSLPPPPMYSQAYDDGENNNNEYSADGSNNDEQWMLELDLEAFGFETDDSFSSAPSLLANCLVSSAAIYTAVPVGSVDNISDQLATPTSQASETDSSTSSYATGTTSLVGASFLECLFPLFPPNSGFLEKLACSEKGSHTPQRKAAQMRKENLSMEILKKKASGCCIFGTSINLIEGQQWKKFQPRLKLL